MVVFPCKHFFLYIESVKVDHGLTPIFIYSVVPQLVQVVTLLKFPWVVTLT